MTKLGEKLPLDEMLASKQRRQTAQQLQIIEDNPLTPEDISMFEMFERERWSHERRRAYILEHARKAEAPHAAE
jgi:hypothetical protein